MDGQQAVTQTSPPSPRPTHTLTHVHTQQKKSWDWPKRFIRGFPKHPIHGLVGLSPQEGELMIILGERTREDGEHSASCVTGMWSQEEERY